MMNANYVIEVVVEPNERVSIPLQKQPEKKVICTLLGSGLFKSLRVIDVIRGQTVFDISGPTIAEYGRLWLEYDPERNLGKPAQ